LSHHVGRYQFSHEYKANAQEMQASGAEGYDFKTVFAEQRGSLRSEKRKEVNNAKRLIKQK
jgi:hypothetical protein